MSGQGREHRSEDRGGSGAARGSDPSAPTVRRVALVSGHVQGVGYRWFVRGLADAAGIAGSARNLPDGRVEVVLEGPEEAVDRLVGELDGPRAPGRVTGLDVRAEAVRGSRGFTSE